jgi:hypothetical protein
MAKKVNVKIVPTVNVIILNNRILCLYALMNIKINDGKTRIKSKKLSTKILVAIKETKNIWDKNKLR